MFFKEIKDQNKIINRRSLFILSIKLGLFSLVGWRLFKIQIIDSQKYKTLSKNNQINFEIIYPLRGKIFDRNNVLIAKNIKTYDLYIIPEQTKSVEATLDELNKYIKIEFKKKRKVIELVKKSKKFDRVKILKNIYWDDLEIIEANKNNFPGLHLQNVPLRDYVYNNYFSHIIGYINKPSEQDLSLPYITGMPTLEIGRTGIEKSFNEKLIGKAGKREIEVNAFGREVREISKNDSIKGSDIKMSIDSRVQKYVHGQINNQKAASAVLIKIDTGEIISMVSIPDYDPNLVIKKPNLEYWNSLLNNPLSPLNNRCIQGLYSPGSTFKIIVALAALSKGVINEKDLVNCEGKIEFGDRIYHCWKTKGHQNMNLDSAIKESCDVYFYELAKKIGIDYISQFAKQFGIGEKTGVNLINEKNGINPSIKWKKDNLNENWYAGETLITAIGQGYILTTPLQLAVMTARFASDGLIIKPSIQLQNESINFEQMNIKKEHFNFIKNSMFKVVNEYKGTAFKSKSNIITFSGKTGTSQVKTISLEERESDDFRKKEKEWKNKDHALFIGFAPSKNPKYALSIIVEHGGSGSSTAAPIAKNIFNFLQSLNLIT
ncbi:MAG: Penicillin-binding protein 2 [Alphaproteobacteria bacterium MarineAlpha5_Bin9]|nr:MAG: Penicillin-binding protein 2 [Alphaproteobacteria bacterium MarineAlpha5_Bin9]